jgi:sirohydrochlorin cobaltochelatase
VSGGETIGLVVFAHGSRVAAANDAVRTVAREASRQAGMPVYRTAFLELADPTLADAVADLAAEGVRRVLVTPYFLTMGRHLTEDLPRLMAAIRSAHPELRLEASAPLDGHPDLAGILADRARAMAARSPDGTIER